MFVTSVAKEIARYNTLATNAQTLNVNLTTHVLTRSKAEVGIMRNVSKAGLPKTPFCADFTRGGAAYRIRCSSARDARFTH